MKVYHKDQIKIIELTYQYPFGIWIEILRIPRGWLSKPQYWWLFALQTDSSTSYIEGCILGYNFDWKKAKPTNQ